MFCLFPPQLSHANPFTPPPHSSSDSNIWSRAIWIPAQRDIIYRYLICAVDPVTENRHVRRWETHLNPRKISADHDEQLAKGSATASGSEAPADIDTFGDVNGEEKIDRGWLTTETLFQFKFFHNPFLLKQKLKSRLLYIKVSQGPAQKRPFRRKQ